MSKYQFLVFLECLYILLHLHLRVFAAEFHMPKQEKNFNETWTFPLLQFPSVPSRVGLGEHPRDCLCGPTTRTSLQRFIPNFASQPN